MKGVSHRYTHSYSPPNWAYFRVFFIYISSFMNYVFKSFVYNFIWLFFSFLMCRSYLCILKTIFIPDMYFANISSKAKACQLYFLDSVFYKAILLSFYILQFIYVFFVFFSVIRIFCLTHDHTDHTWSYIFY